MFKAEVAKCEYLNNTESIDLSYSDLHNPDNNISIKIAPNFGSNLYSFAVSNNELIYCERDALLNRGFTGNYVLFPFPNRVKDKKYQFDGVWYSLSDINRFNIKDLIHGFVFDQPWQFGRPVIDEVSASVKTFISITSSSKLFHYYPFECQLSLEYIVTLFGVKTCFTVVNNSQKQMPFGFGLHPYFSTIKSNGNTLVSLPAESVMETDVNLLPNGKLMSVNGSKFDLRKPQPVKSLTLDHVFTSIEKNKFAEISFKSQGLKVILETSPDLTHLVLYTASQNDPFFCLENQTCSTDAVNLYEKGYKKESHLLVLEPGQTHSGFISYKIAKNKANM